MNHVSSSETTKVRVLTMPLQGDHNDSQIAAQTADAYYKRGKIDDALNYYLEAVKLDPNDHASWNQLAAIYTKQPKFYDFEEGKRCLSKAIAAAAASGASKDEAFYRCNYGTVLAKIRTHACNCCGKVETHNKLKACAKCKVAHYCSKECQTQDWKKHKKECVGLSKQFETAEQELRKAIELDPNHGYAKSELALLLSRAFKKNDEATLKLMADAVIDFEKSGDSELSTLCKMEYIPEIMRKMGKDEADIAKYLADEFEEFRVALEIIMQTGNAAKDTMDISQRLKWLRIGTYIQDKLRSSMSRKI